MTTSPRFLLAHGHIGKSRQIECVYLEHAEVSEILRGIRTYVGGGMLKDLTMIGFIGYLIAREAEHKEIHEFEKIRNDPTWQKWVAEGSLTCGGFSAECLDEAATKNVYDREDEVGA